MTITGKNTLMIIILIRITSQRKRLGIPLFSYLVKPLRAAVIISTEIIMDGNARFSRH